MRNPAYKMKYAILGAIFVPCFGRMALHGTGAEHDIYRYFIPLFIGGTAGCLVGLMKDKWLVINRKLLKTNDALEENLALLQVALDEVKTLKGIIPICSHCKKIRNKKGTWEKLEKYICDHSEARPSHSICPDCIREYYPDYIDSAG